MLHVQALVVHKQQELVAQAQNLQQQLAAQNQALTVYQGETDGLVSM